ncbi:hypothetical protein [Calothrix sp. NIES-3974]|nr:hypothetical protein [Calothrix sp. NIES-3974]
MNILSVCGLNWILVSNDLGDRCLRLNLDFSRVSYESWVTD